jgi:DNA-binding MarR family transcriptional regulator
MLEDEIALLLDRLIRYAHSNLHKRAILLREEGLQPTDGILMIALKGIQPAPMHDLVEQLARHKSQVTRTVQKLEEKGLITRTESEDDARVRVLNLTSEGRRLADELRGDVVETLRELLAPLPKSDQQSLRLLLKKTLDDRK